MNSPRPPRPTYLTPTSDEPAPSQEDSAGPTDASKSGEVTSYRIYADPELWGGTLNLPTAKTDVSTAGGDTSASSTQYEVEFGAPLLRPGMTIRASAVSEAHLKRVIDNTLNIIRSINDSS